MNLYQTRLAAGLCVRCGKREPETGRKKCAVCAPKEQRTKCKSCGTEVMVPVKPGPRPKVLCEACKSKTEQEICKGCGEPFSYNRSRGKRIYCSAKCGSKAVRRRQRFKKYKISTEQMEALLQAQDYECPICEEPVSLSSDIDHDHETGEIRGVLCRRCNLGLGFLGNRELLLGALNYLSRLKGSTITYING